MRSSALIVLGCGLLASSASPPVSVSLRSSFSAADPLLEALETLALTSPEHLFSLLNHFPLPLKPATPEESHNAILDLAKNYLLPPETAAVNVGLALHAASPKLAAQHIHESGREGCEDWIDWYGSVACNAEEFKRLVEISAAASDSESQPKVKRLQTDHILPLQPSLNAPRWTAIHYADLMSPEFNSLHGALLSLSLDVEYVLRWARPIIASDGPYLSGYGVALDLKKMDYLAVDDRKRASSTSRDDSSGDEDKEGNEKDVLSCIFEAMSYIDTETEKNAGTNNPLSKEEIQDLGLKAASFLSLLSEPASFPPIISSCLLENSLAPLSVLHTLSTNFPHYAAPLARKVRVPDTVRDEVQDNWGKAMMGVNMVWVNGRVLEGEAGIFGLLRTFARERALIRSLVKLGLSRSQAIEFVVHPVHSGPFDSPPSTLKVKKGTPLGSEKRFVQEVLRTDTESNAEAATLNEGQRTYNIPPKWNDLLDGFVDSSDRLEGGGVILSWNDIEEDTKYSDWGTDLTQLLRTHPTQLFSPYLRLRVNIINVVLALDFSQPRFFSLIASQVDGIVARGFPVRWGFVPVSADDGDGLKMARIIYYVAQKFNRPEVASFFRSLSTAHTQQQFPTLSWSIVHATFNALGTADNFADIASGKVSSVEEALESARRWMRRLGVSGKDGEGFINGKWYEVGDNFLRDLQNEAVGQMQLLQELVYLRELTDVSVPLISTFFYDLPTTLSRRNPYIFSKAASSVHAPSSSTGNLKMFDLGDLSKRTGWDPLTCAWVTSDAERTPVSMIVIANLDSAEGQALVREAVAFVSRKESQSRVTFLHNPVTGSAGCNLSSFFAIVGLTSDLGELSPDVLKRALDDLETQDAVQAPITEMIRRQFDSPVHTAFLTTSRLLAREAGLRPGEQGIIVNGRLIGPISSASEFVSEDFATLETYEMKKRIRRVAQAIEDVLADDTELDAVAYANLVSVASSIIYADQQPDPSEAGLFDSAPRPRTSNYRLLSGNSTKFEFGDRENPLTHLVLLLDPLSEGAQKWITILEKHEELFPEVYFELYLNPALHSEIPLKRFYRYSVEPHVQYDGKGNEIPAQVTFNGLSVDPIYTLGMDVPSSWLVRPREALYDLDNVQPSTLPPDGLHALFSLDYLVVEGHAREPKSNSPPRGVQLQLTTSSPSTNHTPSVVDDTQVVANLGYLQFKARPGTFKLDIREGGGREVYEMASVGSEGWNSPSVEDSGEEFTVMSFEGLTLYPRLSRKPGMEKVDVLAGLQQRSGHSQTIIGGILSKVSSLFTSKSESTTEVAEMGAAQADINIFTVASGLLYERFASIMILSVLRNTNSTVKFWFIENFLSPSFLEFIPHMAEEYGFQYELVTYKWPSWLRAQKEKQRIIWAYKILFLDVLFPMDLNKVIFVDADQIVRADLQELVDLDLHGAPYGYTPMGDDNYEMEGFRFWKTGYWKEFLGDLPYHISALYVVDLVRFRQMAAGDILRGQYQMLSADPNSLANLDQDLPNNIQRDVPIFSLHEDWLWCETWCGADRLHRAKTIDLCQNPLTKEPKLSRARRIPEWEEYDNEIAQFAGRLATEGKIHSSVATARSDVLASVGLAQPANNNDVEGASGSEDLQHPHDEL
ncbi:glycosyltransferase family 24 protein [Suillus clintonianus]|uniref:glycosyltransferase family 24 protein n=1 Tax=Suillus clintonianus TaxID=1904413 RepID=UPI001B85FAE9|nr:glycosyltransferase family 24 protein [Suillus clintonianus]KAG2134823.1 glycosyltransferase family 24 protein [Suillus clintonianus]